MSLIQVLDVSVHDILKRKEPKKHHVYFLRVYWRDGPITTAYRSYDTILDLQKRLLGIEDFLAQQKEASGQAKEGALLKGKPFLERLSNKKEEKALKRMRGIEEFLQCVVHLPSHISESDPVINFFHPLLEDLMQLDLEQFQLLDSIEKHRRGSKYKHVHYISEPFLLEQYVAIADYSKSQFTDISLREGNVVDVIEKHEHGWWFVDLDGEVGWAPASYLKPRDGTVDDDVLETFKDGEEETCITMADFKPELEDEIGFKIGDIVKVKQRNLDGWCFIRFEEKDGWAPSMYLREVATSSNHGKQRKKHAVREMLRDPKGRRQTWIPLKRKKSVERKVSRSRVNQTESTHPAPPYVNLEFLEKTQHSEGRPHVRQKLNPDEVRAKISFAIQKSKSKQDEDFLSPIGLLTPRPLSVVEEEVNGEMTSRGTSPIMPGRMLREASSSSSSKPSMSGDCGSLSFRPFSLRDSQDGDMSLDAESSTQLVRSSTKAEDAPNDCTIEHELTGNKDKEFTEILSTGRKYYVMGTYEKEDDLEVNLIENTEVEVLEVSEGGWWLVRTSRHSIGWAPSNYLERLRSLTCCGEDDVETDGNGLYFHAQGKGGANRSHLRPERPSKSSRAQKIEKDVCIGKRFWSIVGKDKGIETFPIGEENQSLKGTKSSIGLSPSELEENENANADGSMDTRL